MACKKVNVILLVSMLVVVMASVEMAEAGTCYNDCMIQCMPIKYATRPQCESQCDQACKSIGQPGKPHRRQGHHKRIHH
ncbi:hypothetical protein QJS04_geneDACA017963 [Acorus gramineus]|uniref:Plant thionin family protein n=1 Tax=Acorus gramineus TaxID=55184 RepID=A0AAV9A4D7_ACOGR|nr:hypothetical protein QJS04_geneDACA017963 [Acorus gramineus]